MADDNNIEFSDDSVSKAQDIKNAMKEIARETGMANKEMQKNGENRRAGFEKVSEPCPRRRVG